MKPTGKTATQQHQEWMKDPEYTAEYAALEDEFSFAEALIEARSRAGLSQDDMAKKMQTSQPSIARLEGGSHNTSLKTLKRYADATNSRLKIILEPLSANEQDNAYVR